MQIDDEIRLKKENVLNNIIELYNPNTKYNSTYYRKGVSRMEQLGYEVEYMIQKLEKEINELKETKDDTQRN